MKKLQNEVATHDLLSTLPIEVLQIIFSNLKYSDYFIYGKFNLVSCFWRQMIPYVIFHFRYEESKIDLEKLGPLFNFVILLTNLTSLQILCNPYYSSKALLKRLPQLSM